MVRLHGRRWVGWGFALLLLLGTVAPARVAWAQAGEPPPDDDVDAITALIDAVLTAWEESDADALDAMTSELFTWIDSSGTVHDRDGWLEQAAGASFDTLMASNVSMVALGADTVQVMFNLEGSGASDEGPFSIFEATNSLVTRSEDGWLLSFVQGTTDQAATDAYWSEMMASMAEDPVASAMSAAPASISAAATILGWPTEEGGDFEVLQEGDNGWTCFPDDLRTADPDPICGDAVWLDYIMAYATGEEPDVQALGTAYMQQNVVVASTTDPMLYEPADGDEWVVLGPHIMMIMPGGFDEEVFTTDAKSGLPFILWSGTPWEVLMIPTADPQAAVEDMADSGAALPVLTVDITEDGIIVPEEVVAGPTTMELLNSSGSADESGEPISPIVARLREGVTLEDVAVLAAEEGEDPTPLLAALHVYGFPVVPNASVAYDLQPGQHVVLTSGGEPMMQPFMVVEGEMAAPPEADATVELKDFTFIMPDEVAAGPQTWEVVNNGNQWHEMIILTLAEGATLEDLMSFDMATAEGPPPFEMVYGYVVITEGERAWVDVDLPPGEYTVICFLPDLLSDMSPHATHGMVRTLTVTE